MKNELFHEFLMIDGSDLVHVIDGFHDRDSILLLF